MSLMDLLPGYVQDAIKAHEGDSSRRGMREDLLLIPAAEAAGWVGSFRNDHWHNGVDWARGAVRVWGTGRDWRRVTLSGDGTHERPDVFRSLAEALGLGSVP